MKAFDPRTDGQPDDPKVGVCPCCGCRCRPDPEKAAKLLLQKNAGRFHKNELARFLNRPVGWLEKFARRNGISLDLPREDEPRGA